MEELGDVGLWCVVWGFVQFWVGVAAAEEAVRDGDADEKEVDELPAVSEDGVGGLGGEEGEEGDEDDDEDGFEVEAGEEVGFCLLGLGGWEGRVFGGEDEGLWLCH